LSKLSDLIIAHRGESHDAPENTISAINLAWERNVKSVEIDIRLTKDHEIVVFHDENTKRISGVRKIVSNSSLEELKHLDAGSNKDIKWKNEFIPTLHEVINTIPAGRKLIIEIKGNEKILYKLKNELYLSKLKNSQIEIISFNEYILEKARNIMPDYKMLWLLDLDYYWPWWICRINKQKIIEKVKKMKFDGIDAWAGRVLTKEFIDVFKSENLLVYTWTVNDPEKAQLLIESGVDGVTTDRASWLTEQLTGMNRYNLS